MRISPLLRRALATGAAVALVASLSACSLTSLAAKLADGADSSSDWVQPAEIHNSAVADETASLLAFVQDGAWQPPAGGNILRPCDAADTYAFYGSWISDERPETPAGAESAAAAVESLSAWFESRGWADLEKFDFTTDVVDVNALGIAGSHPAAGISEMQTIFYYEGDIDFEYPHIVVDVDTVCLPSDEAKGAPRA